MKHLRKIVRSFGYSFQGLRHAYQTDKSFQLEINYGLPIYIVLAFILAPFAPWEFIIFIFTYFLILIVELINTAFEKMLDKLHPEEHALIGRSKDISSASVLMAFVFAALVMLILVSTRLSAVVQ